MGDPDVQVSVMHRVFLCRAVEADGRLDAACDAVEDLAAREDVDTGDRALVEI